MQALKGALRTPVDPVQKMLLTQLEEMRAHSAQVLLSSSAEPLHDLRIATLRASFALKFFRKFLEHRGCDGLRDVFFRARRVMAKRRDWDIFSAHMKMDFKVLDLSPSLREQIGKVIKEQKARAHKDLTKILQSHRYQQALEDLKWISSTRNKKRLKAAPLLNRCVKRMEREPLTGKSSQLHKVRIAFKQLRYACEFLSGFYAQQKLPLSLREMVAMQDWLGDYRDAINTVKMLNRLKVMIKSDEMSKLVKLERKRALDARKKFTKIYTLKYRHTF